MFFGDYKKHKNAKLDLSLLWDYNTSGRIPWKRWKSTIIRRTVIRGDRSDWYFILNKYGIEEVRNEILKHRWDREHYNFLPLALKIDKRKLRCSNIIL